MRKLRTAFGVLAGFALVASAQTATTDTFPPPLPDRDSTSLWPPSLPPAPPEGEAKEELPPREALPPAVAPDLHTFERELEAHGRWQEMAQYGRIWIPAGVAADWQPYAEGRWVATDWGWSFVAVQPWGRIVFHYGRWGFEPEIGWFWVPGFDWAPAWVFWRMQSRYIGWAPFAPQGYRFQRRWHGWIVVPSRYFTQSIREHRLAEPFVGPILRSTVPAPSIHGPVRGFFGPPRRPRADG